MKRPTIAGWLLLTGLGLIPSAQAGIAGVGTCSKTDDCDTGCCSKEGYCGFGPDFCDDDVCISSCDAVAECGKYAATSGTKCPLNVCCSEFGFCGTTEEFCGGKCQSGCEPVNQPSCSGASNEAIYIGYYEGWSSQRSCDVVLPENINVSPWTHLYYSFAGIDPSDSTLTTTTDNDKDYWAKFSALKKKKPSLKVIDIDWEYPAADDRGGAAGDTKNLVTFLSELKEKLGEKYGLTVTLPSSYWYLKGFDLKGMEQYVDWFNFMAYDIHGTWDGQSEWTSSVVNPHTNLTEISGGLDLLWRNDIKPGKVLLGLGFYGRGFTLADRNCSKPGCDFYTGNGAAGGADAGECTGTSGFLSDYEISRIIDDYSIELKYDETAAVNWMTWSGNQWVSFDNSRTLKQKADFANSRCLGGLFSWAIDLGGPGSLTNPNSMSADDASMGGANAEGGSDGTGLLHAGQDVLDTSPTVTAIAPVSIIFPKSVLKTPTTIDLGGGYPTSLEIAWSTIKTITSGSITTTTSTITRYIVTTTISLAPITTNTINYHNWNISSAVTSSTGTLIPSINIPPVVVTDNPNPLSQTGVTHPPVTRTVSIPPWPWTTSGTKYPIVTFTQGGPPGPTCTADCGHECSSFCSGPCLSDCGKESSLSFIDPLDTDPPSIVKCSGPDCVNGKCVKPGLLCIARGCTGKDCKDRICVGDDCIPTACIGDGCEDGHCVNKPCQDHGCTGDDCHDNHEDDDDGGGGGGGGGGRGRCFGPLCISWGCVGPHCSKTDLTCTGPLCRVVTCSGSGCSNGVCTGPGCKSEDQDCESEEADTCTEWISSELVTPASTYSTTTVTAHCESITACAARPTTTTSTVDSDGLIEGTIYNIESWNIEDSPELTRFLDDEFSSFYSSAWDYTATTTTTTTTATTSTTTKTTTTTTTRSVGPKPTAADGCAIMNGLQGVCWNKCDVVSGKAIGGDWSEGEPWCWLMKDDVGAFCNDADDCPSDFECQPDDWELGGCQVPPITSGGCALMNGIQGVCWSKCDPRTSLPILSTDWHEGEPWCWLKKDDVGAFCRDADDCPATLECQPSDWELGGCSANTPTSSKTSMNGTSSSPTRPQGLRLDKWW